MNWHKQIRKAYKAHRDDARARGEKPRTLKAWAKAEVAIRYGEQLANGKRPQTPRFRALASIAGTEAMAAWKPHRY